MPGSITVPNKMAATLFLVAWGTYLISEAARTGSSAKPLCSGNVSETDDKYQSRRCEGYSAAAAWDMFGAISSFVSAGLVSRDVLRNVVFLVSLGFYAFALLCENGGISASDSASNLNDDHTKLEESGSASAAFWFFWAAISVFASAGLAAKDKITFSLVFFFTFLGLSGIGWISVWGWQSHYGCKTKSSSNDDASTTDCAGYGFAAFCAAMAMIVGFAFAAVVFRAKEEFSKTWTAWFSWILIIFLGTCTAFATEAKVYCQSGVTNSYTHYLCEGLSAGAFWIVLAFIAAILGLVFSLRAMDELKHATFMGSWSLYFLGYACFLGGYSAYNCHRAKDESSSSLKDDYEVQCNGFAAGCFFSIVSFVVSVVGTYYAYKGGDEAHQQMDDVPGVGGTAPPAEPVPDYTKA